jgi:hypothetical protein
LVPPEAAVQAAVSAAAYGTRMCCGPDKVQENSEVFLWWEEEKQ